MVLRTSAVILVAITCAGCAQERGAVVLGYQTGHAVETADVESAVEASQIRKKSLAAKVLAAIALERVTGRKPDPARLAELN
jgi:hypothetical protein